MANKVKGMLKPYFQNNVLEAGCDEAGRGCLAGPVFAAAVVLPFDFNHDVLNDSKMLSAKKRNILREMIEESALAYAVSSISPAEIDEINILNASIKAMHSAVDKLKVKPGHLLIDGNRFHAMPDIPHTCFVKGDSKYFSIAAASILAKTHRDAYMEKQSEKFPVYNWTQNKGYPTLKHKAAIAQHGTSPLHRKSFKTT